MSQLDDAIYLKKQVAEQLLVASPPSKKILHTEEAELESVTLESPW